MTINPIPVQDTAMEQFLRCCHKRRYPTKQDIIQPGDFGDTLYYIVEGSVSVCVDEPDGGEIVLAYMNKGEFIGEMGVFIKTDKRGVTVRTRQPCQLAEISYNRLEQLLEGDLKDHAVAIIKTLGRQLSNRLLHTTRKVRDLAFVDVEGRIARALLDLCKQPDAMTHPDGMQIRITRQELGRIVGCSREMAGRVLKNLEENGRLTAKGKTIVVLGTR